MRVRIFMFIWLYCVWQIRGIEKQTQTATKATKEMVKKDEKEGKIYEENGSSGRDKEFLYPPPLVAPYGGTLKLVVGIAVPISIARGRILVFGQNFQFQYVLPQNASFFTNFFEDTESRTWRKRELRGTSIRRRRDVITKPDDSRSLFYRSLELDFQRWGANGRDCVMRSICEAAESPLKDQGLVGELLHVILTPDHGLGTGFNTAYDNDYLRAAQAGRSGDDCSLIYPGCPEGRGLLDRISQFEYV